MKKLILFTFLLCVVALVSCNKMDYDLCFSQGGGAFNKEMDIDGETLKILFGNECSYEAVKINETEYCATLDWVLAFYRTEEHYLVMSVDENTTGRERRFTVSGTKNGMVVTYKFRQR